MLRGAHAKYTNRWESLVNMRVLAFMQVWDTGQLDTGQLYTNRNCKTQTVSASCC